MKTKRNAGGECQMKLHILEKIIKVVRSIIKLPRIKKRGRKFIYKPKDIAIMFAVMILKGIDKFKSMHKYLTDNEKIAKLLNFKDSIPDRTTLSRRFKNIYGFIKEQVKHLGSLFLKKKLSGDSMISIDSTMHHACGNIWHKKHKKANVIPDKLRNIDKDAHWGYSQYKHWVYGYKTHLLTTSSFKSVPLPIDCEITTANITDSKIAVNLLSELPEDNRFVLGDKGYDVKALRTICAKSESILITPIRKNRSKKNLDYAKSYRSQIGKKRYAQRGKTIEPLFGYIKDLFLTHKLVMKGLENVKSYLSIIVWLYQTLIYYNFICKRPLRRIKYLVCAV